MSDSLRELLVEISYKDKASPSLEKVDKKVDSLVDGFGSMGKSVSNASIGVADLGSSAKRATKDIEKIDKRHKLWQLTASGMDKVLHSNEMQTDSLRQKVNRLGKELDNYPSTLKKVSREYGANSKEVLEYKDTITDLRLEHAKLNKELTGLGAARMGQSLTRAGGVMSSVGSWGTKNISLPIAVAAGASINTFVTLEDAFSDVSKTFKGTDGQLKNTRKELDHMASNTIPVARKELYGIAANAGQLGVGAKNVVGFTDTIAKLGATTNLTYESASSDIAQFANITKMSLDNVDRLGSTIVELGNNTQTTEADIVSMAMRLGAAGKQVGMNQAEIMGLSAGMSSLGMEAEAGGSAVSKLLFDMQEATMTGNKQLGKYAKVAGLTGKEFKKAFEDNAGNALIMFTQGLGEMQKEGKNVIGTLNDMGLSEVRLRDAVLRAAGSNDVLNRTINMGNIAWEQNIALNDEFANKSKTSASNIQLMKSKVEGVANAFGEHLIPHVNTGLDLVTKMTNKFGELSPGTKSNIFNGALGAMIVPSIMTKLGKFATGIGRLSGKVAGLGGWIPSIKAAGAAILSFATGPIGIAIGALAILAGGIYATKKAWDRFGDGTSEVKRGGEVVRSSSTSTSITSSFDAKQWSKVVGRNALGTNYWKGGLTELSERGTELVVGRQVRNLPTGSKVINNRDTENLLNRESQALVTQETTFAPVFNITLTDGNRGELEKTKETIRREFEAFMEEYFFKLRNQIASAN